MGKAKAKKKAATAFKRAIASAEAKGKTRSKLSVNVEAGEPKLGVGGQTLSQLSSDAGGDKGLDLNDVVEKAAWGGCPAGYKAGADGRCYRVLNPGHARFAEIVADAARKPDPQAP